MYSDELLVADECGMRFELTYRKIVRWSGLVVHEADDCKLYGTSNSTLLTVLMRWNREGKCSNLNGPDYVYAPLGIVERI